MARDEGGASSAHGSRIGARGGFFRPACAGATTAAPSPSAGTRPGDAESALSPAGGAWTIAGSDAGGWIGGGVTATAAGDGAATATTPLGAPADDDDDAGGAGAREAAGGGFVGLGDGTGGIERGWRRSPAAAVGCDGGGDRTG